MVDKATYVFEKLASLKAVGTVGLLGAFMLPTPRKTVTSVTNNSGKYMKMKDLINVKK